MRHRWSCRKESHFRLEMRVIRFSIMCFRFTTRIHLKATFATFLVCFTKYFFIMKIDKFSGLTVHLSDKRPEFIADVYLFVSSYGIPPHQPAFFNNVSCTYESDVELHPFAFRTHTHAMGRVVSSFFKHDGQWRKIGKRNPQWPQVFLLKIFHK